VQAGPQLLPTLTAEKEAFVRTEADDKQVDSIGTTRGAARTAVGITDDGYALLATVADARQDPESGGITLQQLADLLKRLGCVKAINFDGGASTTMFVRLAGNGSSNSCPAGQVVCGKSPETRVKSVLLLQSR
jgi:exopolysaccharide biosynthesis protein